MKVLSYFVNRKMGRIVLETDRGFFRVSKSGLVERRCDYNKTLKWRGNYLEKEISPDGYIACNASKGTGTPGALIISKCYRILGV